MKDTPKDDKDQIIQPGLQKKQRHQYQANQENQINPVVVPDKSSPDENELIEKSTENEAFTENEQSKKSNRPVAGDGASRLM